MEFLYGNHHKIFILDDVRLHVEGDAGVNSKYNDIS